MRLSFLCVVSLFTFASALAGCFAPRDAIFRGTSTYTIAPKGGGPAIAGAEPQDALLCWRGGSFVGTIAVSLGPDCALMGDWGRGRESSGTAVFRPDQSCSLMINGTSTAFTVAHGSLRFSNPLGRRVAEASIAGPTTDGARYVSLQHSSTESGPALDADCTEAFHLAKQAPAKGE